MDADEDFMVTDSGSPAASSSSKIVVMVKNDNIVIRVALAHIIVCELVWVIVKHLKLIGRLIG